MSGAGKPAKCAVCSSEFDAALTYDGKPGGKGRQDRVGSTVHAVGEPSDQGARWAACNISGRFIPTSEDWTPFEDAPGRHCSDCVTLMAVSA